MGASADASAHGMHASADASVRTMVLVPPPTSLDPEAWRRERDRAFATGARRQYVAATTLARRGDDPGAPLDAGLAKGPRDLELPPWNKGRYGTAIGRAVHAVLQTVDLATGAGVDDAVAAQAAAEGVLGHEATLATLTRAGRVRRAWLGIVGTKVQLAPELAARIGSPTGL